MHISQWDSQAIGKSAASESLIAALLLACRLLRIFSIIINNFRFLVELFNFRLAKPLPKHPNVALRSKSMVQNTLQIVDFWRKVVLMGRGRAVSPHFFFYISAEIPGATQMQGRCRFQP